MTDQEWAELSEAEYQEARKIIRRDRNVRFLYGCYAVFWMGFGSWFARTEGYSTSGWLLRALIVFWSFVAYREFSKFTIARRLYRNAPAHKNPRRQST